MSAFKCTRWNKPATIRKTQNFCEVRNIQLVLSAAYLTGDDPE